mgnify:CR=1 FL=1|tara:strand:+ start:396 stop:1040 length:645 start_codon:yes stop_codon:yes gene_type:complete
MKLITETIEDVEFITETAEDGKKTYAIEGIFMQAEQKNRNGRIYPSQVLENEVNRYTDKFVNKNRAVGELGHPDGPTVNLERVSHMITGLKKDGNNYVGKAKILETPYGKIVQNLISGGMQLGVSSRGMGSLEERNGVKMVKEDFMLAAVDIVADPSAPNAFVNGIMEGREWVWENGVIKERTIDEYRNVIKKASSRELEEKALHVFKDFLSKL